MQSSRPFLTLIVVNGYKSGMWFIPDYFLRAKLYISFEMSFIKYSLVNVDLSLKSKKRTLYVFKLDSLCTNMC